MTFLTETEPKRGIALDVLPGIRRVVARNPSVMTYFGTNTYLISGDDGLTIIDPGPDDDQHVQDLLKAAAAEPITRLLLTHTHSDHLGATAKLQAATGARVYGYRHPAKAEFEPDVKLDDGSTVAGLTAVHTPGHAADHLSFAHHVPGTGEILFSGDHVMSWSSSIVSPPDGDMVDYYKSLELLLGRHDTVYLSGHGPLLRQPRDLVRQLLSHRQRREATILAALQAGQSSVAALAEQLYHKTDYRLKIAAQRNVLAHLLKLAHEGRVVQLEPEDVFAEPCINEDLPPEDAKSIKPAIAAMFLHDGARRFALAA
ncbi:MAG: MBL fold metallo-hydrolase [Acidocella sp.]|nr:MBL fold metallo-hydrolase [Acidocella sp.]